MEYIDGITFTDLVREMGGQIPEEKLFDAMELILEAYEIGPNPPEKKPAILGVIT